MRLILAEDALAAGGGGPGGAFETQINAIRDLENSDAAYDFVSGGAVSDLEALQHTRRVNALHMGLRLQDMYRWGITDPTWQGGSAAALSPGTMLPITVVERRANCHISEQECPG